MEAIKEYIQKCHAENVHKEKEEGTICQIWEDLEITLQKSGSRLWMHPVHLLKDPTGFVCEMPTKYNSHSYACVTIDQAYEIRRRVMATLATLATLATSQNNLH